MYVLGHMQTHIMYIHVHTYMSLYLHTCTHMHTHTHTHTYTCPVLLTGCRKGYALPLPEEGEGQAGTPVSRHIPALWKSPTIALHSDIMCTVTSCVQWHHVYWTQRQSKAELWVWVHVYINAGIACSWSTGHVLHVQCTMYNVLTCNYFGVRDLSGSRCNNYYYRMMWPALPTHTMRACTAVPFSYMYMYY